MIVRLTDCRISDGHPVLISFYGIKKYRLTSFSNTVFEKIQTSSYCIGHLRSSSHCLKWLHTALIFQHHLLNCIG